MILKVGHFWMSCIKMSKRFNKQRDNKKKNPKMYTLGIEMCIKDNKRNDKPSWVCFIVTVFPIEGERCSGKTVPSRFPFLKQ